MPKSTIDAATVQYAGEMTADLQKTVTAALKKHFPGLAEVSFVEEAQLLGGLKITYRDYVYDDSIRHRLAQLRNRLAQ
ncbi:hypothetical protein AUK40_05670 [Candidatus Wirthbacteria bacterium CG2_30_54_11]|uniref:Uncharacterized protein n=1 Tax=Candidatus Wirthbacteria bacterium CG2_30_54_11 TaxID=1817892 RepID=A0A1J5IRM5_9BACT|nr:MAG: hypothetical protein AUK40_05670 [Candidatus Wirthbacteria bacterium CG2_30_54_11]